MEQVFLVRLQMVRAPRTWCNCKADSNPALHAFGYVVLLFSSLLAAGATAQPLDKAAAEQLAGRFWVAFDQDGLASVYQSYAGPSFREVQTQQQFVQQVGLLRIQAGGRAQARVLVGSQPITDIPNGPSGAFYYVRYKARYPNGFVFQDVLLEKDNTLWRVYSFNLIAAPPD